MVVNFTFYPAIQKDNAHLITDGIKGIEAEGVRLVTGELVPLDVIVLATGFDNFAYMRPGSLVGRSGHTIDDAWKDGTYPSYHAVLMEHFPNYFLMLGPGTPIGNKATGVEYRQGGKTLTVAAAKEVILSAGAFQSPQLLMLSGIGPAAHLQHHGIPVIHDSPAVGQNLQDHPDVVLSYGVNTTDVFGVGVSGTFRLLGGMREWFSSGKGLLSTNFTEGGAFFSVGGEHDDWPNVQLHFVIARVEDHGRKIKPGMHSAKDLRAEPVELNRERNPATPAIILYTGGTTGRSKGVVHSHASLVAGAMVMAVAGFPTAGKTYSSCFPFFHVAGIQPTLTRLIQSSTQLLMPMFRPDLAAAAVRDHGAQELGLAPTMMQMLITDPEFSSKNFSGLERLMYGSSPISAGLLANLKETFPDVTYTQAYGMTEAGITIFLGPQFHSGELECIDGAGQPGAPGVQICIEDDNGAALPQGQVGEIVVYGPTVMSGYRNRPSETDAALRSEK